MKYKDPLDPESAYEMLTKRMEEHAKVEAQAKEEVVEAKKQKEETSVIADALNSPLAKQIGREVVRGVFGMLFGKSTRTRKTGGGLFGF
jgi:hypothetical protein